MKTKLSRIAIYLFVGVLAFSSCSKDDASTQETETVSDVTHNSVTVTWNIEDDDTGYAITVTNEDGGLVINREAIIPTISGQTASYNIKNLDPDMQYTVVITVTKSTGFEDEITLTVKTGAKPSPEAQVLSLSIEIEESLVLLEESNEHITPVSENINDADEAINTITRVTDGMLWINSTLKTVSNSAKLFKSLPVVGTITSTVYYAANTVQEPVGTVCNKIDNIQDPTINPIDRVVESIKNSIDNIQGRINKGQDYLYRAKTVVNDDAFIALVNSDEAAEQAMDEASKYLGYMNDALLELNNSAESIGNSANSIAEFDDSFSEIEDGMQPTKDALNTVKPGFDALSSAMSYEIGFKQDMPWPIPDINISFSINDILNGIGDFLGFLNTLLDMVADYLQDILSDIGVDIPEVPGLDTLDDELDELTNLDIDALQNQASKLTTLDEEIIEYQNELNKNIEILEGLLE